MKWSVVIIVGWCWMAGAFSWAQGFEGREKIRAELEKLRSLSHQEYAKQFLALSQQLQRYLEYQKKICFGEFSALIFDSDQGTGQGGGKGQQSGGGVSKKLSQQERKVCFKSLVDMQKAYVEISFDKRAEFLQTFHNQRMQQLRQQKAKELQQLRVPH